MRALRWLIIILALSEAGGMLLEGNRALYAGDYVSMEEGPRAHRLGAWSRLAEAAGVEPRSILMKGIFAAYGAVWFFIIVLFGLRKTLTWDLMLLAALASLWYLPLGTALSLAQIILLGVLRWREAVSASSPQNYQEL